MRDIMMLFAAPYVSVTFITLLLSIKMAPRERDYARDIAMIRHY